MKISLLINVLANPAIDESTRSNRFLMDCQYWEEEEEIKLQEGDETSLKREWNDIIFKRMRYKFSVLHLWLLVMLFKRRTLEILRTDAIRGAATGSFLWLIR